MTTTKAKPSLRIDKKVKTTILNYGLIKNQIKSLTKQKDLIKIEILPYFEKLNAIMLVGLDKYEGIAQRVSRNSKRFNLAKFKEQNPKLYASYLVDSSSIEIKVDIPTDKVSEELLDESFELPD